MRYLHLKTFLTGLLTCTLIAVNAPFTLADQAPPAPASGSRVAAEKPRTAAAQRILSFYREHISAVDGDRCPSHPSCSAYSIEAFRKHGFIKGWLMTVDRLIHEGSEEAAVSPRVYSGGRWKIYDPVENNDFWWHRQGGEGP